MRITASLHRINNSSCNILPFDTEIEDYLINIKFPPCPTLQGGTLVVSADSICQYESVIIAVQNSATDLSIAGVSYQWQRSDDGINWSKDYSRSSGLKDTTGLRYKNDSATTRDPSWRPAYFRRVIYCGGDSAVSTVATVGYAPCFPCNTPNPLQSNNDYISRIKVAGLDNSSGYSPNGGYTDYTLTVPPVQLYKDSSVTISAKTNRNDEYLYQLFGVWIDYNQDGIFQAHELSSFLFYDDTTDLTIHLDQLYVPANALSGLTKMRVFYKASQGQLIAITGTESCNGTFFSTGEIEDYAVNINDNPGCAAASDTAIWGGHHSSSWEDPLNWRCGRLPDDNSKVIIPGNAYVIINSTIAVYSLTVSPGATVRVNSGNTLTVLY